jgi:hypothetical protein
MAVKDQEQLVSGREQSKRNSRRTQCLIKHSLMYTYGGNGGKPPRLLNLCINGREESAPCLGNFAHSTRYRGGWAGHDMSESCGNNTRQPLVEEISKNLIRFKLTGYCTELALLVTHKIVTGLKWAQGDMRFFTL